MYCAPIYVEGRPVDGPYKGVSFLAILGTLRSSSPSFLAAAAVASPPVLPFSRPFY